MLEPEEAQIQFPDGDDEQELGEGDPFSVDIPEQALNAQTVEPADFGQPAIDPATLELLGLDPTANKPQPERLHEGIVTRWDSYLRTGLDKGCRKDLLEKYCVPENCKALQAPRLNAEVDISLNDATRKQDKFLVTLQDHIGSGLTALGLALNSLVTQSESSPRNTILPKVADAGQLFTHLHYMISSHRRYLITPHLNAECKKIANDCPINDFLFGTDLSEKLKARQSLQKTARDLRAGPSFKAGVSYKPLPSFNPRTPVVSVHRSLNSTRPSSTSRMKTNGGERHAQQKRKVVTGHQQRRPYLPRRN